MIGMVIAADEELKGLVPDASWDVQGVRDMVGGVVAVALVLAVGVIVIGCISMVPGLITNNVMERAFSWKRLAAALMVPFTIGAACTGWAWSANLFGSDGLKSNTSYSVAGRKVDSDALKDGREKGSDSLGSLVSQLGKDIASSIGDTVKDAVSSTVRESLEGWKWLTGGDGQETVPRCQGRDSGDGRNMVKHDSHSFQADPRRARTQQADNRIGGTVQRPPDDPPPEPFVFLEAVFLEADDESPEASEPLPNASSHVFLM